MLESLLAVVMSMSVAAPAPSYDLPEVGVHGFKAQSIVIDEPEPVVSEPRQPAAASRSEAREIREPVQPPETIPEPVTAPSGGVLGIAASYVGAPYVLYGTPPASFDCSGFTWWVFKQAGINIPKSVNGQRAAVTPVSTPQPGDLVLYNDWHHVGIYAGNGMTYEALNPGTGVRFGPILSENVWYGRP